MEDNKNFLTRDEYLDSKELARKDAASLDGPKTSSEIYDYATKKAATLYDNPRDDRRIIYVSTFMLPDDEEFIATCKKNGSNLKDIAAYYKIDTSISRQLLSSKIMEINKYYAKHVVGKKSASATGVQGQVTPVEAKKEAPVDQNSQGTKQDESELSIVKKQLASILGEMDTIKKINAELSNEKADLIEKNAALIAKLTTVNNLLSMIQATINDNIEMKKEK